MNLFDISLSLGLQGLLTLYPKDQGNDGQAHELPKDCKIAKNQVSHNPVIGLCDPFVERNLFIHYSLSQTPFNIKTDNSWITEATINKPATTRPANELPTRSIE